MVKTRDILHSFYIHFTFIRRAQRRGQPRVAVGRGGGSGRERGQGEEGGKYK